jgi:hypothetical protein
MKKTLRTDQTVSTQQANPNSKNQLKTNNEICGAAVAWRVCAIHHRHLLHWIR